jgi:hypothetical protein
MTSDLYVTFLPIEGKLSHVVPSLTQRSIFVLCTRNTQLFTVQYYEGLFKSDNTVRLFLLDLSCRRRSPPSIQEYSIF